jgi:hypothetical protein
MNRHLPGGRRQGEGLGTFTRLISVALLGQSGIYGDTNLVVCYLPGTTGWGPTFGGRPTALWTPQVRASDAALGIRTNQFGFQVNWASGRSEVVEASTKLNGGIWIPLQTNTLVNGSFYFSDPAWTNYPARFYRVRSP